MSGDIKVNTKILRDYASKIDRVNRRLIKVDGRLKRLYFEVPVNELLSLTKADALTGYSWRLTKCSGYLREVANNFECVEKALKDIDLLSYNKNLLSEASDKIYDVGTAIKKGAGKVSSFWNKAVRDAIQSYNEKGTVYKIAQYGKAVLKAAKGITKITTAAGTIIATGGATSPVAVLSIISGLNDIYNATNDAVNIHYEEYDEVGKDFLKDKLVEGGRIIGSSLGNEKIGEVVGAATYYGIDIVTSLDALGVSMDKVKQLSSVNISKFGSEVKEIASIDVSKLFTTDIETLRYKAKLAGYLYTETGKVITSSKILWEVGEHAVGIGEGINDIYSYCHEDFKNPVLNKINKVLTIKKNGQKTADRIIKINQKILN